MEKKFKCCKKDFNNYICVNCYGIFHTSCLNRIKNMTEIDGYRVYCSVKCENEANEKHQRMQKMTEDLKKLKDTIKENNDRSEIAEYDYNSNIEVLHDEITNLKNEIKIREEHYLKEKKKYRDIEDEAMEMEQRFLTEMKMLTERNRNLTESTRELTNKLEDLENELLKTTNELRRQQQEYNELLEINKQMIISIRSLETENEFISEQLKKKGETIIHKEKSKIRILENKTIKFPTRTFNNNTNDLQERSQEIDNISDEEGNEVTIDVSPVVSPLTPEEKITNNKYKILIIGDESVRNLTGYVKSLVGSDYMIEGIAMPHIELEMLSKSIFKFSFNYGVNDLIICSFKTSNVSNHKSLHNSLNNIFPISKFTNIILLSQRSLSDDKEVERKITNRVYHHNRRNRNMYISYYSNIYNLRGFIKKSIINLIPKFIEHGSKYILLKSVITHDSFESENMSTNLNKSFFRVE